MDLIHALAAKYAVRQNAAAFLELWALFLLLAASSAIARKQGSRLFAIAFAAFALATAALGIAGFRWGSSSAPGSLGMIDPSFDQRSWCLALGLGGIVSGWFVIVVTCLGAIALTVYGLKRQALAPRALALLGAAFLLFVTVVVLLGLAFNYEWCGSHRLF